MEKSITPEMPVAVLEHRWSAHKALEGVRAYFFERCPRCEAPGPHDSVPGWAKEQCRKCGTTFGMDI